MSRKPRVLQISHDYEGPFRQVCHQYSTGFAAAEVTTVYLRGAPSDEIVKATGGDRVVFLDLPEGSLRGLKLNAFLKLRDLCAANDFDLVVAHRYKPIYLARLLSFFHQFQVILGVAHEHGLLKRRARRWLLAPAKIEIIAVSSSVAADIRTNCPSLTEDRLHVLGNTIDTATSLLTREAARDQLGLDPDVFWFGTVGRLVSKKSHEQLIESVANLDRKDVRLVLVGDGPRRQDLEALAVRLGVDDAVRFTGHIEHAARSIPAFDAFIFTAGPLEAFGIVLLEAMLAEVPVVCSDSPGPREVVGDSALVFEAGSPSSLVSAMKQVLSQSSEERSELVDRASERLKTHFAESEFGDRLLLVPSVARVMRDGD